MLLVLTLIIGLLQMTKNIGEIIKAKQTKNNNKKRVQKGWGEANIHGGKWEEPTGRNKRYTHTPS